MLPVAGLIENDGGEIQQVEACLNQLGVTDDDLHSILHLSRVPRFSFGSIDIRP
jgi:hypothetical protein